MYCPSPRFYSQNHNNRPRVQCKNREVLALHLHKWPPHDESISVRREQNSFEDEVSVEDVHYFARIWNEVFCRGISPASTGLKDWNRGVHRWKRKKITEGGGGGWALTTWSWAAPRFLQFEEEEEEEKKTNHKLLTNFQWFRSVHWCHVSREEGKIKINNSLDLTVISFAFTLC